MLPLNQLEGFYQVAVHRSYARAARHFRYPITQPGVHQQVKKLEQALDTRLFERVGRGEMALTAAGRYLFDYVQPFFEGLPAVTRHITEGRYGGELRIDAGGMAIRQVMPAWVRRIRQDRADVRVSLTEHEAPTFERLRTGKCDLVVDFIPDVPSWSKTHLVAEAMAWLVVPTAEVAAESATALEAPDLDALRHIPFVAYPEGTTHRDLQFEALSWTPEEVLSANSADAILAFVAAGLGFSLIPWIAEAGPAMPSALAWPIDTAQFPIIAVARAGREDPLVELALSMARG